MLKQDLLRLLWGPIWDNIKNITILVCIQNDYYIPKTYIDSIGLSTYTFNNRHQQVLNWQTFIRDHILPNHSQWEDFGYHRMTTTNIKRYLIATQWSIGRGPTVLGKRERCVTTISQFLTFFPGPQSIIYIIVELEVEEQEQDRISSLSQKPMMKLESANKHTTSEIATDDILVKQEVDCEIHQRKTDIVDGSHSGHTTESMKIKSEQVEVYNVDFINSIQANNNMSKHLIPEIIGSGSSKLRLLNDW